MLDGHRFRQILKAPVKSRGFFYIYYFTPHPPLYKNLD
ncbi:hypothetical protein J573_0282 [Acinetobacter baumannii 1546444]|nr:hypothetical protein J573_0282 [Acinetobacter baumannii 1546444]